MENLTTVLDFGYLRLVDHMGTDLSIVRAARVSYNAEARAGLNESGDRKLINYLMKNNHSTPFESATVTFEVCCPIFVARQWHRHRTQSYNEVSARYTDLPNMAYLPFAGHIGQQSVNNKQQRNNEPNPNEEEILRITATLQNQSFEAYKKLQDLGCPRELARIVLTCGTYTRFFTTMNLLNAYKFCKLRAHSHSQYEIRVYAEAMLEFLNILYPVSTDAFLKNDF